MDKVSDVVIGPLQKSIYLSPYTMYYTQNGTKKSWDLLKVHDSVAILILNKSTNKLVFVKQFRPPVYFGSIPEQDRKETIDVAKYPPQLGITLELCAGLVDKEMSLAQIAKEEILEECGFDVPIERIQKFASYRMGVGSLGSLQTSFYCEVNNDMRVSKGGGVGDEIIDVVEMTVEEVKEYMAKDGVPSPPSFMFAVHWFLCNKNK